MNEMQVLSFVIWSAIAGAVLLVSGFSYRAYSGRRKKTRSG